ncbi:MAG: DegT/DnrJ/EryC1/StrS family aminotransferase [Thermoplasmata archaeon]|nr:MAG: DegT/DnrJ/EryC1/StrS family aminotransferase [Thermoplasmata archaeon]
MTRDNKLFSLLTEHEQWRMNETLNLIPSENVTSPEVRELLASDLGHRYTLNLDMILHGVKIKNAYGGTKYTDLIEDEAEELCKDVFNAKFCTLKPLSGHVGCLIMLSALCKPGDFIMGINAKHGGYDGYMPEYIPSIFNLKADFLPFNEQDWNLDHEAAHQAILEKKPRMVIIGASFFLFPYDIKPIREACTEVGAWLGYDASHVLGLIAGGEFQDPLGDGVDIMIGSTHKTLPGPQGGLLVTNNEEVFELASKKLAWSTLDNPHQNRIAALGQTLLEMKEFGSDYAKQVIANSKKLANSLANSGLPVKFGHRGYTETHQILLDIDKVENDFKLTPMELMNLLESENIIIDTMGRMGTNEMTRRGCKEEEMEQIASFMERVVVKSEKEVKNDIIEFLKKLTLAYCF